MRRTPILVSCPRQQIYSACGFHSGSSTNTGGNPRLSLLDAVVILVRLCSPAAHVTPNSEPKSGGKDRACLLAFLGFLMENNGSGNPLSSVWVPRTLLGHLLAARAPPSENLERFVVAQGAILGALGHPWSLLFAFFLCFFRGLV